jgi:hypothetical protein
LPFRKAILEVGIYSAKANGLTLLFYVAHPQVLAEVPIVSMVVFGSDIEEARESLKCHFGIQCFFSQGGFLK